MSSSNVTIRPLDGYHHTTIVCRNGAENARFYRDTLRLRLVKKTVNFDMPDTYHLYYGDYRGSPGSLLTFFEWPDSPNGRIGWGGTHHIALSVATGAALAWWRGHLEREGIDVRGPFDDHGFPTIRFQDPDGLILELSAPQGEDVPEGAPALWAEGLAIGPLHHVAIFATNRETALTYYRDLMGFDLLADAPNLDDPSRTDLVLGLNDDGSMRLVVTIVERDSMERAQEGVGQTHHIAFGVANDPVELAWQERVGAAGIQVTDVRDRQYFHSIYFSDPDGHLLEIATANPGFSVDEPLESLGERLSLPPWYEDRRAELEQALAPID